MAKAKAGARKKATPKKTAARPAAAKKPSKIAKLVSKLVAKLDRKADSKPDKKLDKKQKGGAGKGGKESSSSSAPRKDPTFLGPAPDKAIPRRSKLPPLGEALNKREMEQLVTAGGGRGVDGEGSLKGKLIVRDGFPYLLVIGRDKRELWFLLEGPDQEVLPAYTDHKVSVSGRIKKTTNYGGVVYVRKYSAKKPEAEVPVAPVVIEEKLKFLSPGEVEQLRMPGMAAGLRGFASLRGALEMTGEDYFIVVSNAGTRAQVSFLLEGKGARGIRKLVGQLVLASGVISKTTGWGGNIQVESVEPRPLEHRAVSRDGMNMNHVEAKGETSIAEVPVNGGLTVRLQEKVGHTWAIEPTTAKRVGLREANFEPGSPASREFFFTPRTPGGFEVEFFLGKALTPAQVVRTHKLTLTVKP